MAKQNSPQRQPADPVNEIPGQEWSGRPVDDPEHEETGQTRSEESREEEHTPAPNKGSDEWPSVSWP